MHATFMARPGLPNFFSSGWHLHQSLIDRETGDNAFTSDDADHSLSPVGRQFVAGLLEHALPMTLFGAPDHQRLQAVPPVLVRPRPGGWAERTAAR